MPADVPQIFQIKYVPCCTHVPSVECSTLSPESLLIKQNLPLTSCNKGECEPDRVLVVFSVSEVYLFLSSAELWFLGLRGLKLVSKDGN